MTVVSDDSVNDGSGEWWHWCMMAVAFDINGWWWQWWMMTLVYDGSDEWWQCEWWSDEWWQWCLLVVVSNGSGVRWWRPMLWRRLSPILEGVKTHLCRASKSSSWPRASPNLCTPLDVTFSLYCRQDAAINHICCWLFVAWHLMRSECCRCFLNGSTLAIPLKRSTDSYLLFEAAWPRIQPVTQQASILKLD